jgi:DNA-binding LytR/AlgR family response regulator
MLLTKDRLTNLVKVLPDSLFVRIHRSYIVQFAAIEYIEGNHVKIKGQMIPVSQGYRKNLDI